MCYQGSSFIILQVYLSPFFILNHIILLIYCILDLISFWFISDCIQIIFSEFYESVEFVVCTWKRINEKAMNKTLMVTTLVNDNYLA